MIRDRGKVKWQPAHFLPEQKNLLNELYDNAAKQKKPIIDEQAQEQISILIMESLHYTMQISINTWKNGHFNKITGIVDKLDYMMQYIIFDDEKIKHQISLNDIVGVERDYSDPNT